MKKGITAILLAILLVGTFGAAVASAVASNNTGVTYGPGFMHTGFMHRWAARYTDAGAGYFASCPYFNANGTVDFKVKTVDDAFEIAKAKIDENVSKDNIYQMNRWWIVSYEDKNGVYTQARIDAVTGEVYTGYNVPAGPQAGNGYNRGLGYGRGSGYCMGHGR